MWTPLKDLRRTGVAVTFLLYLDHKPLPKGDTDTGGWGELVAPDTILQTRS